MPTYVYKCDACGQQFEKFQSFKDEPLTTCICGQEGQVRRVFQPAGIVFKGSGWYITDSRGSNSARGGKSEDAASDKSENAADNSSSDKGEQSDTASSTPSE